MQIFADYEGREIALSDGQAEHIADGHKELIAVGVTAAIAETLASPDVVVLSKWHSSSRLYYRRRVTTPYDDKYICVVVKFLENEAWISTAYILNEVGEGEVVWKKENG